MTASVPFPPPLAFFAGLALGFDIQYFLPVPILRSSSGIALRVASVALGIVCFILATFAIRSFRVAYEAYCNRVRRWVWEPRLIRAQARHG
jgi:hypothetical protein